VLSFIAMYVLMYAMVDRLDNVFNGLNQVYMAGLMTAPMVAFELLLMRGMFKHGALNAAILSVCVVVFVGFWFLLRVGCNRRRAVPALDDRGRGAGPP